MKKLIASILITLLFFSCNMDVVIPNTTQTNDGKLRLVLGSTQARSVTEGHVMARLDKADFVRVRFVANGSQLVRSMRDGNLAISGNMLTVSDVPSGFYTSVEVDIMDKLNTYTAVAKAVTLSAAAANELRTEMTRVTPHLIVQDTGNKYFYTFPDLDDLSLCFAVKTDQPNELLNDGFTQTFFDKWGCFFGRKETNIPMLVPSAYSESSITRSTTPAPTNNNGLFYNGNRGLTYYDRTANKLYEYDTSSGGDPSLSVQTVTWTGAAYKVNIKGNFNATKAIAANGNTLYRVREERSNDVNVYVDKFTLSFTSSPTGTEGMAEHKKEQKIITFMEPGGNALLDIVGNKLFVFAKSGHPAGSDGPGTLFVLDAENLSVIASVQLDSQKAEVLKMLGVRGNKVYFAVDDADTTSGTSAPPQDYVGVYDLDNKTFSKADSARILAAAKNALDGIITPGTAAITPKIDYQ